MEARCWTLGRAAFLFGLLILLEKASALWEPPSDALAAAWTGCVRVLDACVLWILSRAWGLRFPSWKGEGWRVSIAWGTGTALAFGAAVFLARILAPGDFFRDFLGGGLPVGSLAVQGTVLVLLGPAVEEILFRGALLEALRSRLGPAAALVLSALVFALFHLPQAPLPWIQLTGGLAFAALALRTRGLLAPWILHAAGNGFLLALGIYFARP